MTNYLKRDGLDQQRVALSQFLRLEAQSPDVGRAPSPEGSSAKSCFQTRSLFRRSGGRGFGGGLEPGTGGQHRNVLSGRQLSGNMSERRSAPYSSQTVLTFNKAATGP